MRVIIAGGRTFNSVDVMNKGTATLIKAIRKDASLREYHNTPISCVVSGTAYGADYMGELHAKRNGIPIVQYKPNWSVGKSAGFIRNAKMANNADALLAFWDGVSRGTKHMIDLATSRKLPTIVIKYDRPPESRLARIGEDHMAFNFSWIEGDFRVFNFKKVPNE